MSPLASALSPSARGPAPGRVFGGEDDPGCPAGRLAALPEEPAGFLPLLNDWYQGSESTAIDSLQARWQRRLELALPELRRERLEEILLCLRETCLNALRHGCQQRPDRRARLSLTLRPDRRELHATVDDPGPGHDFDWQGHGRAALARLIDRHRGLSLIHAFASQVRTAHAGAQVHLGFALDDPAAARPLGVP